jgi:hypothetical protein
VGACAVGCAAALTLRHCTGAEGRWHAPCDSARPWPSGRPAPECSPGRRHRRSWLTASVGARRGDERARSGDRRMAAVPGQRHRGEGAGRWRAIPAGGRGAALGAKQAEGQAAEGLRPRGTVARARGRAWRCGRRQPRRGGQRAPTSALLIGGTGAVGNKQGTYRIPPKPHRTYHAQLPVCGTLGVLHAGASAVARECAAPRDAAASACTDGPAGTHAPPDDAVVPRRVLAPLEQLVAQRLGRRHVGRRRHVDRQAEPPSFSPSLSLSLSPSLSPSSQSLWPAVALGDDKTPPSGELGRHRCGRPRPSTSLASLPSENTHRALHARAWQIRGRKQPHESRWRVWPSLPATPLP